MLKNPSWEEGWDDLPAVKETGWLTNQRPKHWNLDIVPVGGDLFGSGDKATGIPECLHKISTQLPPDEQLGAPNALILHGKHVYKVFHRGASFGVTLSQVVSGLKPGTAGKLIVPIRIHGHQSGDDHYAAEAGVWVAGKGKWVPIGVAGSFSWFNHIVNFTVPASGVVDAVIRFKSKWPQPVDFFTDNLQFTAVVAGEPEPPEPPPPPPQRGKPREQYKRIYVLLPPIAADPAWAVAAASATVGSRYTVGYSADDAFVGDLDQRHVIAVNPAGWGTGEDGKGLRGFGVKYYGLDTVAGLTYEEITAVSPQELFARLGGKGTSPVPFDGLRFGQPLDTPWRVTSAFNAPRNYSAFGGKPNDKHEGLDVAPTVTGTSHVLGMYPGRVVKVASSAGYGNYVITEHTYNGRTFTLWRAHLQSVLVSTGQAVTAVTRIGVCGSTGNSSGIHDHTTMQSAGGLAGYIVPNIWDPTPFYPAPGTQTGGYTGPAVTFVPGLDQPASSWQWQVAHNIFGQTKLAPKFHTSGNSHEWYTRYRHPSFNIVRVVIDRGFAVRDADAVFDEVRGEIGKYWGLGARDFILLNEPNITHEHLGKLWDNGAQFGDMFRQVSERVRVAFPGIRIWSPGFSPGFGAQHQFIADAQAKGLFTHVSGVVEHVYSGTTNHQNVAVAEMVAEVRDFQQRWARTRPLVIGEFSVNRPATAAYKAAVYKKFFAELAQLPGIQAAYSFTSSWAGNPDVNGESWLERGIADAYRTL